MEKTLGKRIRYIEKIDSKIHVKENLPIVNRFISYLKQNQLAINSIFHYARALVLLDNFTNKKFGEVTREDLELFLGKMAERFSPSQIDNLKIYIKRFYKWFMGNDEQYPPLVRWIKKGNRHRKLERSSLLTYEDFLRMVQSCSSIRDRAILWLLWESGVRVGELVSIKIRDVQILSDKMFMVTVRGKTGSRSIPLIMAVPDLKRWLEKHPLKDDPNAFLFISSRGNPLTGDSIQKIIFKYAAKANLSKKVYPHLFRHSRATELASEFREPILREFFGWSQSSRTPSIYLHLSSSDVLREYSQVMGFEFVKPREKPRPKECRCGEMNPPDSVFCSKCGAVLDVKAARQIVKSEVETIHELKERINQLERFLKLLLESSGGELAITHDGRILTAEEVKNLVNESGKVKFKAYYIDWNKIKNIKAENE